MGKKLNFTQKNTISLSPLIKLKDVYKSIVKSLFNENEKYYKSLYRSKYLYICPRSTISILKVYEYLNKFYNKKVIFIPDYICNESLSLIRKSNAKIIFYDHSKIQDKKLIKKIKDEKADIFLYVNYFGKFTVLSKKFLNFIKNENILIIEDNTHCIEASKNGFSEIEIYSPHKLFGIEDGSIIKFQNKKFYKEFANFNFQRDLNNKQKQIKRIFNFLIYILKKSIRKILGYKYPKLNFSCPPKTKLKINKSIGIASEMLLNFYTPRVGFYKSLRRINYYEWDKNLRVILPFVNMEEINYVPYLGILKFKNTLERKKILEKYNAYGLPIGNWPDLPPEVIKSKKVYAKAIYNFENKVTIPIHQDITKEQIRNCVEQCFDQYINSFRLIYCHDKKEILITEEENFIGKIFFLNNIKTNQNIACLKFEKNFYLTYFESIDFFYKFSKKIISKLEKNRKLDLPKNIIFNQINKDKSIKSFFNNEIPLNISDELIMDYLNNFLEIIYENNNNFLKKIKDIDLKVLKNKNFKNEIHFVLSHQKNKKISIFKSKSFQDHLFFKEIKIIDNSFGILLQLMKVSLFCKKKGYDYIKIDPIIKKLKI